MPGQGQLDFPCDHVSELSPQSQVAHTVIPTIHTNFGLSLGQFKVVAAFGEIKPPIFTDMDCIEIPICSDITLPTFVTDFRLNGINMFLEFHIL